MTKKKDDPATSTALTVVSVSDYAIMQLGVSGIKEAVEANMVPGEGIREFDLDRVGVPSGGGLAWTVIDDNGEPAPEMALDGVIILHGQRRVFYLQDFEDSGGGPPDCSSLDGRVGTGRIVEDGDVSGNRSCSLCPHAQWGSSRKYEGDKGQRCSLRRVVFLLRRGDVLPLVIDLAPTSYGVLNKFLLRLTSKAIPCYGAVVSLKLSSEQSNSGIKYSVVAPRLVARLSAEETAFMKGVSQSLKPFLDRTQSVGRPSQDPDTEDGDTDAL